MEIAAAAGIGSTTPRIRDIHLVKVTDPGVPHVLARRILRIPFGEHPAGNGYVMRSRLIDGKSTATAIHAFRVEQPERDAAGAVLDAIVASGLLALDLPANDRQQPAAGRSRLYVDARSRFLEFDTASPPALVQPVLQALAGYEAVARRA